MATYSGRTNSAEGIFRGCTQVVQNLVQLVDVTELAAFQPMARGWNASYALSALEDRLASEKLSEDTSNAPHINGRSLQIHAPSASRTR